MACKKRPRFHEICSQILDIAGSFSFTNYCFIVYVSYTVIRFPTRPIPKDWLSIYSLPSQVICYVKTSTKYTLQACGVQVMSRKVITLSYRYYLGFMNYIHNIYTQKTHERSYI